MIDFHTYQLIHQLRARDGLSIAQIARQLDLYPGTVAIWLKRTRYEARKPPCRSSKLDDFRSEIVRLLHQHPYSAQQVFQRLREAGYSGGITIVRSLVRQLRPPVPKAFLTLHFLPGQCAQVDWGHAGWIQCGNTRRRVSFFVLVLAYSRRLYLEFTLGQAMEFFLGAHQNALAYLGGVPAEVWVDYVPRHIIWVLCPTRLCGRQSRTPVFPRESGNTGAHNLCGLPVANSFRLCRKGDCHDRKLLP